MNYIKFDVTGVDRNNKRFKKTYSDPRFAFGINLWRGSVWGVTIEGTRKLLKRVYN